jgi:methionyl-tRNA synthetase
MITIEDLQKVEIKVGKILSVEEVEGSDKLYKLSVDLGEEKPRQVLSGIKKFFEKDFLLDKQFAFITNLAPRKMMGFDSEAMILATGEESLALLSPTVEVKNGSQMR